jgi:hypothetical protein
MNPKEARSVLGAGILVFSLLSRFHRGHKSLAPRCLAPSPTHRERSFPTQKSPSKMLPRVNRRKPRPIRLASTGYQTSHLEITRCPFRPRGSAPT